VVVVCEFAVSDPRPDPSNAAVTVRATAARKRRVLLRVMSIVVVRFRRFGVVLRVVFIT
jgi:hypothetical protein